MTHENTNRTNDQSKASTGKSFKLNVSDLSPRNELKGGVFFGLILPAVQDGDKNNIRQIAIALH